MNRRTWIKTSATAGLGAAGLATGAAAKRGIRRGRINQSIVYWCFEMAGWSVEQTCRAAVDLGCKSVELVPPEQWPLLKKHGLVCALTPSHLFVRGMNNRNHWDECLAKIRQAIDDSADAGFPNVITFTGYADTTNEKNGSIVDAEEGMVNCIEGYKKIIAHAEKKKVNLCLEQLNTRDDSHPMKGVPGYQGDKLDYVAGIIRKVGSPRMKMLFDVFHVQIMDGDLIRRIEENKDLIAHVHTAGNPGRGELDDKQEINYPPVMRKLLEIGCDGFVGQEFMPTRDPMEGLAEAVEVCDV